MELSAIIAITAAAAIYITSLGCAITERSDVSLMKLTVENWRALPPQALSANPALLVIFAGLVILDLVRATALMFWDGLVFLRRWTAYMIKSAINRAN